MVLEAVCFVGLDGNQLELQHDTVNHLTEQLGKVDYIAMLCVLGAPSSAKTAIINSVIKSCRWRSCLTGADSHNCDEFLQPIDTQRDAVRIDGVVCTRALKLLDSLGRKVGVILLDVWNNLVESGEVYGKLVDFCFQASSVTIFSLSGPLRQVSLSPSDPKV